MLTSATLSTDGDFAYVRERLGLHTTERATCRLAVRLCQLHPAVHPGGPAGAEPAGLPAAVGAGHPRALPGHATGGRWCCSPRTARCARPIGRCSARSKRPDCCCWATIWTARAASCSSASAPRRKPCCWARPRFWEGIDVVGDALSVLVIAKLPFRVPTDPIFAARSEQFDDAFSQYSRAPGHPEVQAGVRAPDPQPAGPRRGGHARPPGDQQGLRAAPSSTRCPTARCAAGRCATSAWKPGSGWRARR